MKVDFSSRWIIGFIILFLVLGGIGMHRQLMPIALEPVAPMKKNSAGPNWLSVTSKTVEYRFHLSDGKDWTNAMDQGQVVILFFWSTWAHPCQPMIGELNELWQKCQKSSLHIIGLDLDTELTPVEKFLHQFPMLYPYAVLSPLQISRLDQIKGVPTLLILSKQGKLVKKIEGRISQEELERMIAPFLDFEEIEPMRNPENGT